MQQAIAPEFEKIGASGGAKSLAVKEVLVNRMGRQHVVEDFAVVERVYRWKMNESQQLVGRLVEEPIISSRRLRLKVASARAR